MVISNDTSGWSDVGDREAWAMHHDYVYRTTTARGDISLEKIWGGIKAVLAKRGAYIHCDLPTGLFQGWTGTMDWLMNVRLSLYCVRLEKRAGRLRAEEGLRQLA